MSLLKPQATAILLPLILLVSVPAGFCSGKAGSPSAGSPAREVRAVWLTTVGALDWPSSYDTAEQRRSLGEMIGRLSTAGFNTIFFQVRGRGDAVYRPGLEPWSHVMTGTPGRDPGWDPLAFVLAEAHARGMEVHAWFNTYLVRGLKSAPPRTTPRHVIDAHREWVRRWGEEWWLDPGEPGVERYLVGVAMDIVSRYDVDGLQLDYIRYPGRSFDDGATYARYGRGVALDRWRRENVTRFITRLREEMRHETPWVKLGVAPIGIYLNPEGVRGLESYSDVFQDSYEWVRRGIVDYVAPQLYWPIGGGGGDPDFAAMVREWRKESRGRHLYAGIASYKPEVLAQRTRPVEVARESGADGEAFFRYGSLEGELPLGGVYSRPALPPEMPWKDNAVPEAPESVTVGSGARGARVVRWRLPTSRKGYRFVSLYRTMPEGGGGAELLAVLPFGAVAYEDSSAAGLSGDASYEVRVVSRSGVEGPPARTAPSAPPAPIASSATPGTASESLHVGMPSRARGRATFFLPFTVGSAARVTVSVSDRSSADLLRVFEGERPPGAYVVSVDMSGFPDGRYRCSVRAGNERVDREILLGR